MNVPSTVKFLYFFSAFLLCECEKVNQHKKDSIDTSESQNPRVIAAEPEDVKGDQVNNSQDRPEIDETSLKKDDGGDEPSLTYDDQISNEHEKIAQGLDQSKENQENQIEKPPTEKGNYERNEDQLNKPQQINKSNDLHSTEQNGDGPQSSEDKHHKPRKSKNIVKKHKKSGKPKKNKLKKHHPKVGDQQSNESENKERIQPDDTVDHDKCDKGSLQETLDQIFDTIQLSDPSSDNSNNWGILAGDEEPLVAEGFLVIEIKENSTDEMERHSLKNAKTKGIKLWTKGQRKPDN